MIYVLHKSFFRLCLVFVGLIPVVAYASSDSSEVAKIYQTTLDIMYRPGKVHLDSLIHYSEKGTLLAKKHNLLTFIPDFTTNVAYGYKQNGELEKAMLYAQKAYKEASDIHYPKGVARSGYTQAIIRFDRGEMQPGFNQIAENLKFAHENGLKRYLFLNYHLLANINTHTNNLLVSDYYMEKAFRFSEDSSLFQTLKIKNQLKYSIMEGKKEEQEKLYAKFRARLFKDKNAPNRDETDFLFDIANSYLSSENNERAIAIFEELSRFNLLEMGYSETTTYAGIAAAYLKANQLKKAEALNHLAIRSRPSLYNSFNYLTTLKTEAFLKENKGQHKEALKIWKEIYKIEDSLSNKRSEISYLLVSDLKNLELLESKYEFVNKENAMQRLLLEKERREKVLLLALALLLMILCAVIYGLFRKLSVSNQKILEQNKAISDQTESLRESNFTKDKLFSLLSHELRSPVAELITILDVNEWKNRESSLHPYFKSVNQKAKTIYTTLDNILIWSASQLRNEKTEIKPVNINEIVNTIIDLNLSDIGQKNIRLENEVAPVTIDANENYLMIIFRNILNNAIKFTPAHGLIRIYSLEEENHVGIVIQDSGRGIPPEKLKSLFVSVQDSAEGTEGEKGSGVGLVLCKDLMNKLQGKVEVSSVENQGTSIKLTFKRSE